MSIQLRLLFIYTQPSEILSRVPQNVKEPENYFLQLSHECRSSECWWSQHMFDHLTLEETSIWSYHICRVQTKPINSRCFFSVLSLSLSAFQRWRWTAGMKTWPSCIIKTVAAVTPAGRTCGELWPPCRRDSQHLKSNVHAGHWLPSFHRKEPYEMRFAILK